MRINPHFPELRPGPILLPESFCVSPSALSMDSLSRADLPKPIRFFPRSKVPFLVGIVNIGIGIIESLLTFSSKRKGKAQRT